jgi:hypothetical protein
MMSPSRVFGGALSFVVAAVPACTPDDDPAQACTDPSACGATATIKTDFPLTFTFADLARSSIAVCRNDTCVTGSFASINAPPSPNTGVGFAIDGQPDGGAGAGANALLMATDTGALWLQVFWPLGLGTAPADGDQYTVTVVDGGGIKVVSFQKTATYEIVYPFGKDCPTTCRHVEFDEHTS